MGKSTDVTAPATIVTTYHVVDVIKAVDITKIGGATTTVDATKATDVTAAGIAAANATPTPWMRTVTNPDPAHRTEMIAPRRGLTRAPASPGSPAGVEASTPLTSAMTAVVTLPTSGTCSA